MFPTKPFYAKSKCDLHGETDFVVVFLTYNPETHQITYFFCCTECIEEEGPDAMGITFSCSVKEWNSWSPKEDEPVLS